MLVAMRSIKGSVGGVVLFTGPEVLRETGVWQHEWTSWTAAGEPLPPCFILTLTWPCALSPCHRWMVCSLLVGCTCLPTTLTWMTQCDSSPCLEFTWWRGSLPRWSACTATEGPTMATSRWVRARGSLRHGSRMQARGEVSSAIPSPSASWVCSDVLSYEPVSI